MLSTSLAAAAVTGLLASGSIAPPPAWQTDYRKALALATEQQKPVAVFIARGATGYAGLVSGGGLNGDASRLLRQGYVCLHVDTATADGQRLAGSFQMAEGLVISSRAGTVQALRHAGPVTQADLTQYLTRFAEPTPAAAVVQTVYAGTTPAAPAQPAAPAYSPPVYQPTYSQPAYQQPRPILNTLGSVRSFFGGG